MSKIGKKILSQGKETIKRKIIIFLIAKLILVAKFFLIVIIPALLGFLFVIILNPAFLIAVGATLVVSIVYNSIGEIIGINTINIRPANLNNISLNVYVNKELSPESKTQYIKELQKNINNNANNIKNDLNLDYYLGEYKNQNSIFKQAIDSINSAPVISWFTGGSEGKNLEEVKNTIESLYDAKYNKKNSDYLFFYLIQGYKGNLDLANFSGLGEGIISSIKSINIKNTNYFLKIKNGEINSISGIRDDIYKGEKYGLYLSQEIGSGKTIDKFYQLNSFSQGEKVNGNMFNYRTNDALNIDLNELIEYFYIKSSIGNYLSMKGLQLTGEYNPNDFFSNGSINSNITKKEIPPGAEKDLELIYLGIEKNLVDKIYNNNYTKIEIYNLQKQTTVNESFIKKEIIKKHLDKLFTIYSGVNELGLNLSFGMIDLPSKLGQFSSRCRMTQLYGPSQVSKFYVAGIHNGYDFAFGGIGGTGEAYISSMYDGEVIEAKFDDVLGNYVLIKSDSIYTYQGRKVKFVTEYMHLKNLEVVKGQKVYSGQKLGIQGETGNSKGVHLHLSIFPHFLDEGVIYSSKNGYLKAITLTNFFNAVGESNIIKDKCSSNGMSSSAGSIW